MLARDFANFDLSTFELANHHHLRWGSWIVPFFFNIIFGDGIEIYYYSTIVPSTLAGLLFVYLCSKRFGFVWALVFLALWFTDKQLNRGTFQLLPTGQGLLPLALMGYLLLQLPGSKPTNKRYLTLILCCWFWMYGVKETNLFFTPGILFYVYFNGGFRAVRFLLLGMLGLYAIECLFFILITNGDLVLGRAWQLLFGDAKHMKLMSTMQKLVKEQNRYFDHGVTIRWYMTDKPQVVLNFIAPLLSLFYLNKLGIKNLERQQRLIVIYAVLCLSFLFFTTIFIVSLDPIRLGQPLRDRYLAIILPLAFILVMDFVKFHVADKNRIMGLSGLFLAVMFLSSPIEQTQKRYSKKSVSERSAQYHKLAKRMQQADCIHSKIRKRTMHLPNIMPLEIQKGQLKKLVSTPYERHKRRFHIKLNKHCKSNINLDKSW